MDVLSVAVPEGGFCEVKEIKGSPIPDEKVLENISETAKIDLPIFKKCEPRSGAMVFVAGGPTLLNYLDEISARKKAGEYIITSNHTHDFMIEKGIIPDACLIMDPKERVKDYVKKPHKDCTYYCATVVVPQVMENLKGFNVVKVLVAYGIENKDIDLQHRLYPNVPAKSYLIGGTMTPLRAMPFATMHGFSKIEYYGFDSCYGAVDSLPIIKEGEPGYAEALLDAGVGYEDKETGIKYVINEPPEGGYFYAYKKKRAEDCHVAEADGKRFLTSPGFAYQAKQIVMWSDRLEGKLEIVVHGYSLSSVLLNAHNRRKEQLRAEVGTRRWTEEYGEMQRKMHERGDYGINGSYNRDGLSLEMSCRLAISLYSSLRRPVTIMDYACGNGDLGEEIEGILKIAKVTNYDPFHPKWRDNKEPGVADIVICADVLEHVEEQCVENTINFIADRCRYGAYFNIHLADAVKTLPDGRNAHITQRNSTWWLERLRPRFKITEASHVGESVIIIVQKIGAEEIMKQEHQERLAA